MTTGFVFRSSASGPRIAILPGATPTIQIDDGLPTPTSFLKLTGNGMVIQGPATSSGIVIRDATGTQQVLLNNTGFTAQSGSGGPSINISSNGLDYEGGVSSSFVVSPAWMRGFHASEITLEVNLAGTLSLSPSLAYIGMNSTGTAVQVTPSALNLVNFSSYSVANPGTFRTAIGAAASGANSDITSLTACTSIAGFAKSGANSDITSLTAVSTISGSSPTLQYTGGTGPQVWCNSSYAYASYGSSGNPKLLIGSTFARLSNSANTVFVEVNSANGINFATTTGSGHNTVSSQMQIYVNGTAYWVDLKS